MTAHHIMSLIDNQDHSLQVNAMCSAILMEKECGTRETQLMHSVTTLLQEISYTTQLRNNRPKS